MSGYGVPNPAAPVPRGGDRSSTSLSILERVAIGLGALAFLVAFLPWLGLDCAGLPRQTRSSCESISYQGWALPAGTAGTVLLVLAAALIARRLVDRAVRAASVLPALCASLGALLVLVQVIVGHSVLSATEIGSTRRIGLFLALLTALAEAAVLVFSWLHSTGRRGRRAAEETWSHDGYGAAQGGRGRSGAAPSPGQGQAWGQAGYPAQPAVGGQPGYDQAGYPQSAGAQGGYEQPGYPRQPGYGEYPGPGQQGGYSGQQPPARRPPERYGDDQGYRDQGGYPQR